MHKEKTEIKYIGFYDLPTECIKRVADLSAINKMDYICDALINRGFQIHIVSPSWFHDGASDQPYSSKQTIVMNPSKRITFCPSWGTSKKLARIIKIIFSLIWLFCWLLMNAKRNEKILMYHTPWLSVPIRWAKHIIRFRLILEVEEIYADIVVTRPYFKTLEIKLINSADSYIFSTDLLNDTLNNNIKPCVIVYGGYKYYNKQTKPPDDGKIYLLYAGMIETQRLGAFNALEACKYLSEKYVLNILGFGETAKLQKRISELAQITSCKVSYDGIKSGEKFINYCQQHHIGLSTQSLSGANLESSFPSKILAYLGTGLRVVSGKVECVKRSAVNSLMTYYEKDTPEDIAKAIMSIDLNSEYDSIGLLESLDFEFKENITKLLLHS